MLTDIEAMVIQRETACELQEWIDCLPARQRWAVVLFMGGCTNCETAVLLGITHQAATRLLNRAFSNLLMVAKTSENAST